MISRLLHASRRYVRRTFEINCLCRQRMNHPAHRLTALFGTLGGSARYSDHEDFGAYSVILPKEPFVFGVSHIIPRSVPPHIPRPRYAVDPSGSSPPVTIVDEEEGGGSGRVALGSDAERRLREAGKLARKVREFAGSLVQVCFIQKQF